MNQHRIIALCVSLTAFLFAGLALGQALGVMHRPPAPHVGTLREEVAALDALRTVPQRKKESGRPPAE